MTQADKELLLKDLCARLPYGVKFVIDNDQNNVRTLNGIREDIPYEDWQMCAFARGISAIPIEDIKPYLFPLSSMTEEQKNDLTKYLDVNVFVKDEISFWSLFAANMMDKWEKVFEWCDKNHFDHRGLIPMDLANDATNLNIY